MALRLALRCVTCEDPSDELVVFYRDCTGACVDAAGVEGLRALGFGTLGESACYAKRGCYPAGFRDAYSVEGVNNYFFEDRVAVDQTCVPTCPDGTDGVASGDDYFCWRVRLLERRHEFPKCCDVDTLCWGNVQAFCVSPSVWTSTSASAPRSSGEEPASPRHRAGAAADGVEERDAARKILISTQVAPRRAAGVPAGQPGLLGGVRPARGRPGGRHRRERGRRVQPCQTDCTCMREGDGLNGRAPTS